ncbi:hypothetical protein HHL16_07230 [Pseudoflavitalea sp. G-6-1-2]|uniref:tetratricopeptide repeat protein n=1 Tax=Pseudoflavitalea sp. G-6-1-2 TaxID=2728841 RepID=UPI00146D967D|nr:hypothetical protein [Pseudoflavitalea sp. G-6-1-2]NML20660.1 hypothetical protein [Pseudoflavitalea sp. G-6-1-2]
MLLLFMPFRDVCAHTGDSLLNRLIDTKKPDQQIALLHQLYNNSCYENISEAERYVMAAIDIGMRSGGTANLVDSYRKLAALYDMQRNYMQAHLFYQEAHKTAIENDVNDILPQLNYEIGVVLCRLERFPEALTYLQHASLSTSKQNQLVPKAAMFQAICYYKSGQQEKGLAMIDSLTGSARKTNNEPLTAFYLFELQGFYHHLGENQKALELNETAREIFSHHNDHHYSILSYRDRAEIYLGMDSTVRAVEYLRRALNGINNAGAYHYLKPGILDGLAACYRQLNDPVLSQSYERQSKMLKDSVVARAKAAMAGFKDVSYPAVLPFRKSSVSNTASWSNRLIPLLLAAFAGISAVIWLRYRKMKLTISKEKESAREEARQVAEQEKAIAIREAYALLEKEKHDAVDEARGLVEKVREEARSLQAQIATTSVLLANKTEYLQQLQEKLHTSNNEDCRRFAKEIRSNIGENDYWGEFIRNFNLLHQGTIDKITKKHPDLTPNELKLTCFILSGMNNKEIAGIFSVEPESVKKARYRLKKKLRLTEEESLRVYLEQLQDS